MDNDDSPSGRRIVLHAVHGLGRDRFTLLDGVDEEGRVWLYHHQRAQYACAICGARVTDGWMCFDNGEAVCSSHVTIMGGLEHPETV